MSTPAFDCHQQLTRRDISVIPVRQLVSRWGFSTTIQMIPLGHTLPNKPTRLQEARVRRTYEAEKNWPRTENATAVPSRVIHRSYFPSLIITMNQARSTGNMLYAGI